MLVSRLADQTVTLLRRAGVELDSGLTNREFRQVEERFGFEFNTDHRELLTAALPVGARWVDWRHGRTEEIQDLLNWPVEGVLFDVEHDHYWPSSWGTRPADPLAKLGLARRYLAQVPQLVPIYSHRYMPAGPFDGPSPVLSVYQTDVIYYGHDLPDYIAREFHLPVRNDDAQPRRVRFWTDLIEDLETDFWTAP